MPVKLGSAIFGTLFLLLTGCREGSELSVTNLGPSHPKINVHAEYLGHFKVRNTTSKRLSLDDPGDSCFGVGTLKDLTLEPGEETILSLRLPPVQKEGKFLAVANLSTNGTLLSEIRISGLVTGSLNADLSQIDVGRAYFGETVTFSFKHKVTNIFDKLIFSKIPPGFKVKTASQSDDSIQIEGTISCLDLPGKYSRNIEFYCSGKPYERFNKTIKYEVKSAVSATPPSVTIKSFGKDGLGNKRVDIRNTDAVRLISKTDNCSISTEKKQKETISVEVICRNPGSDRYSTSDIIVSTGHPKQPRLSLPVSLIGSK
jgi:hypothetical protein